MGLNKKQQKFILNNRKLSPEKIAKKLNVELEDVKNFLTENPPKPVPKLFYLVLILIPIIFVVLLEIGLRIFKYGNEYNQWVSVTKNTVGLNPDIGKKYFTKTETLPEAIQDTFDKEKKENSFRVFVLGGSSGAGYPFMPLGSFSRYIDQRLKHVYPENNIEVVNISLTAVNSYTIRDFLPGVLEQNPDLILIYAGHNEYYGALGVGSMESLGQSRDMVNLILYLDKYRITQLVRNFLSWAINIFSGDQEIKSGTLMSRMAEDQSIRLNSDTYEAGLEQFEGNMRDIIEMINVKNINLAIGNLVSNLKDQPPFIAGNSDKLPSAEAFYTEAQKQANLKNYIEADSLYRFAKDLDMLRFRAPEDMNKIILKLTEEYNVPFVNIDKAFKENSPNGLIGNNLMTDHLHPTLNGYQLIGKTFYEKMVEQNFLPKTEPVIQDLSKQDSVTISNYIFSKLDSTIADYKIKLLKNDWPFLKDLNNKVRLDILLPHQRKVDSLAFEFVVNDAAYIDIQQDAAQIFLKENDLDRYMEHMDILIYQYPIIDQFYKKAANDLLTRGKYDRALKYLHAKYKQAPDAYSTKWLGIISLSKNENKKALQYLNECLGYSPNDSQVLYNLAGAYSRLKEYKLALDAVNKALELNPGYTAAHNLQKQLQNALETSADK